MKKRIFTAWGLNSEKRPYTFVEGIAPLVFADGSPDPECEKLFWTIEAYSPEEAKAIYYLRQGWPLNFIEGEASDCPQCGETVYTSDSSECWNCGCIGEYLAPTKLPRTALQKLQRMIAAGNQSPILHFEAKISDRQTWEINISLNQEVIPSKKKGIFDEIERTENTHSIWFKCRLRNSEIAGEGGLESLENMMRAVVYWLEENTRTPNA